MIKSIVELNSVCYSQWSSLNSIKEAYLSEAGKAAMEAYQVVIWHLPLHDTMKSLYLDKDFRDLINIEGKHPEYYAVIRKINRIVSKAVLLENNN